MSVVLDIRTLFFVFSVMGVVLFFSFVYVLSTRKTYAGFREWTFASLAAFLGMLLVGMRGLIPDGLSIVASGTLILSFVSSITYGLKIFLGGQARKRNYVLPVVLGTAALIYFTYFLPSINTRIAILSGSMAAFSIRSALLVHGAAPMLGGRGNTFLTVAFGTCAMLNAVRFISAVGFDPAIADFMAAPQPHGVMMLLLAGTHTAISAGLLIVNFQRTERDLQESLDEIKVLRGIIPICASCKKVRDDKGYWNQIESYIRERSEAEFSHGICPDCMERLYPEFNGKEAS